MKHIGTTMAEFLDFAKYASASIYKRPLHYKKGF